MPYSNSWDETQPLGSAAANTIDDIFRQLKVDIRERMDTILAAGAKWGDDPIGLASSTGRILLLGPQYVMPVSSFATTYWNSSNSGYAQLEGGSSIGIPVRAGWKIKKVELLANKNAAASITATLYEYAFSTTPAVTSKATATINAAGVQMLTVYDSTGLTVPDTGYYALVLTGTGANIYFVYGARITYDEV